MSLCVIAVVSYSRLLLLPALWMELRYVLNCVARFLDREHLQRRDISWMYHLQSKRYMQNAIFISRYISHVSLCFFAAAAAAAAAAATAAASQGPTCLLAYWALIF
jgi:hypothetical protein